MWRKSKILVTSLLATSCSNTSVLAHALLYLSSQPAPTPSCSTDFFPLSAPPRECLPLALASFPYFSAVLQFPLSFTCPKRTELTFHHCHGTLPSLSRSLCSPHGLHIRQQRHIPCINTASLCPPLTASPTPTSRQPNGDERYDDDKHADNGQRGQ